LVGSALERRCLALRVTSIHANGHPVTVGKAPGAGAYRRLHRSPALRDGLTISIIMHCGARNVSASDYAGGRSQTPNSAISRIPARTERREGVAPERRVAVGEPGSPAGPDAVPVELENRVRPKPRMSMDLLEATPILALEASTRACAASLHLCEPPARGDVAGGFVELVSASEPIDVLLFDAAERPEVSVSTDMRDGEPVIASCEVARYDHWHLGGRRSHWRRVIVCSDPVAAQIVGWHLGREDSASSRSLEPGSSKAVPVCSRGVTDARAFVTWQVARVAHEREERPAHLVQTDAEAGEHLDSPALPLAGEPEEQVLGVDPLVAELECLTQGELQELLRLGSERR